MAVFPYHIKHIGLENEENFEFEVSKSHGYYIVLWWRCIPIGDLYLRAGERNDDAAIRRKILHQIHPALEMYSSGKSLKALNFRKAFINKDH